MARLLLSTAGAVVLATTCMLGVTSAQGLLGGNPMIDLVDHQAPVQPAGYGMLHGGGCNCPPSCGCHNGGPCDCGCGCSGGCGNGAGCGCDLGCGFGGLGLGCGCDKGCSGGCDLGCATNASCGCGCGHRWDLIAEGEILYFRYHRADGIRIGDANGEQTEFDFEMSPRVTFGVMREDGAGIRGRYWQYDFHAFPLEDQSGTDFLDVDTYTIDLEGFRTLCLTKDFTVELSAGARYNEFAEVMADPGEGDLRINDFHGWGGLIGVEFRQAVSCNLSLFARTRGAILMDDKLVVNTDGGQNVLLLDSTQGMLELAIGAEYVHCLHSGHVLYARATAEWQNWYNYSTAFSEVDNEGDFGAPADVGFGGYGFAVGITY